MKRFIAASLAIIVFCSNVCSASPKSTKSESVFINLDYYGEVEQINVYNTFSIYGDDKVSDFGDYTSISNLTNKDEYETSEKGAREWDVAGLDSFSYIGKMDNEYYNQVPWNFKVRYKLNGVLIEPKELLHKSGVVEINVDIQANKNANEYYKNNYVLEITGSYDMSKYLSVESDEAMFVSTGNTKTLMFIVLPGQSKDFTLRIGSNDFTMDGLTFAIVPLEGDMLEDASRLAENKQDIEDAVEEINKSADIVLYAMKGMSLGMSQMQEGIEAIQGGTDKIHETSTKRDESINTLKNTLLGLKDNVQKSKDDLENVNKLINNTFDLLDDTVNNIEYIIKDLGSIEKDLNDIRKEIKDLPDDLEKLAESVDTLSDLTKDLSRLIKTQNKTKDIDTDALTTSMTNIGAALLAVQTDLQTIDPTSITSPETLIKIGDIGAKVTTIGTEFNSVKDTLEEIQATLDDVNTIQNRTINDLTNLSNDLYDFSKDIDKNDGYIAQNTIEHLSFATKDLKETLQVTSKDIKDIAGNREDALNSVKNLNDTLGKVDQIITSTDSVIEVIQNTLETLSSDIYTGSNKTTNGLISVTDEMLNITNQADQFISSKNKARNAVKRSWDKIDDKTNLFKISKDIKPVSFASSENESPEKVQFLLKLPDICEYKDNNQDLEVEEDNGTFLTRLIAVFKKMFGWIINLFKK